VLVEPQSSLGLKRGYMIQSIRAKIAKPITVASSFRISKSSAPTIAKQRVSEELGTSPVPEAEFP
jgi:hypothetical protein